MLAVVTGAHLAAVFLGADSRARAASPSWWTRVPRAGARLGRRWRARSRSPGWPSSTPTRRDLYDGLTSGAGLACVIGSAVAGLVTLWLEWRERFEAARYTAAAAVAAIVAGWAVAQEPYLLPPHLTVHEAAAPDATLAALVIAATLGMALLCRRSSGCSASRSAVSSRYEEEPRP